MACLAVPQYPEGFGLTHEPHAHTCDVDPSGHPLVVRLKKTINLLEAFSHVRVACFFSVRFNEVTINQQAKGLGTRDSRVADGAAACLEVLR